MSEVCELLVTTKEGQVLAGIVELNDDGQISSGYTDGYETLVSTLLDTPVLDVKLQDNPKEWFEGLPLQYSGSYFRVAKIVPKVEASGRVLFRGVEICGFSSPEEEQVRAYMSRIPPELIVGVDKVAADPKLGAIHGRYEPKSKTIFFNPKTFASQVVLGKGPGKIHHAQLTMVHEFGHALFTNISERLQDEWLALSGWMRGSGEGQAPPYEEKRPGWPHKVSKWTHRMGVTFTRHYAEKNPDEDFADCFAFCLLSKPAQAGDVKRRWMSRLLTDMILKYPKASVEGPKTIAG